MNIFEMKGIYYVGEFSEKNILGGGGGGNYMNNINFWVYSSWLNIWYEWWNKVLIICSYIE